MQAPIPYGSYSPFYYPHGNVPMCFVLAAYLPSEIAGIDRWLSAEELLEASAKVTSERVSEVLELERDCPGFTPWKQGFTPKEHQEMLDRQWRIEHEEKVRQAVVEREDRRDERAEQWHKEQMGEVRGQHKWDLAILGGAVILATIVGSMIQAGWIEKPWGDTTQLVVSTATPQPTATP